MNTYLKEHFRVAASICFNREVSQGSAYFLITYYSLEYLNVKMPHSKLFQGEYLFPGESNYLLVNKYSGSNYFPINNYWGILSEAVTRRCSVRKGVLKKVGKFTGKHLCHSLQHKCFPVNFANFFKNTSGGCFWICHAVLFWV